MSQSKKRNVNAVSSKALLPPLHVLPTPTKTGRATKTGETGRSGPRSQDPTVRSSVQPSSSDVRKGAAQSVEGSEPLIAATLTSSSNSCFVCNQGIREATLKDDGEQALWCEGRHKQWAHACCVGVGDELYQALQDSDMPWVCTQCMKEALKAYHCLPDLQQFVLSLQDTVASLKTEVAQLKESVSNVSTALPHPGQATSTSVVSSCKPRDLEGGAWTEVVRKGKGKGKETEEIDQFEKSAVGTRYNAQLSDKICRVSP